MSIEGLRNLIHHESQRSQDRRSGHRMPCIVDSYRGDLHAVKVKLLPSESLTGWIQVETDQIGSLVAPNIGDPGWLEFHEGDRRAAVFVGSSHNDIFPPPQQIAAGERLTRTTFGSSLYFKNDGSITATDKKGASIVLNAGAITATDKSGSTATLDGNGGIALTPSGGTATINGNLAVTGAFSVANTHGVSAPCVITGNINLTGTLAASGDVTGNGHSLSNHEHADPQGGSTGPAVG